MLCLVVVSTLMHCAAADECRLYSKEDNLLCMTNSSLMSTVLESNYSWIVEFYASWCGHCQFFAPKWKEFATSIKSQRWLQECVITCLISTIRLGCCSTGSRD